VNAMRRQQRGFTLIELLVALVLGLFLLVAVYVVFATVRTTLAAQQGWSQLQDDERVAMTILSNSIQSAGFFPSPTSMTQSSAFPPSPPFSAAGQVVFGTHTSSTAPDTITIRFVPDTATPARTIDCLGTSGAIGATNGLAVDLFAVAQNQLTCQVSNGPAQPLVGGVGTPLEGVQNIQIAYGIDTSSTGSVTQYMTADAVTSANSWSKVLSVLVTLTFVNPQAGSPGQPPTFSLSRVIAIENRIQEIT